MFSGLCREFKRAEVAIKYFERMALSPNYQAINQLRYAGNHVVKALRTADDDLKSKQIDKAVGHCERAYYDVLDGLIVYLLHSIEQFQSKYAYSEIIRHIPDYRQCLRDAAYAREDLRKTMFVQNLRPADVYKRLHPSIKVLSGILEKFKNGGNLITKERNERIENAVIEENRKYAVSVMVSFLGLVVSIWSIAAYNGITLPSIIFLLYLAYVSPWVSPSERIRNLFTRVVLCLIGFSLAALWLLYFIGGKCLVTKVFGCLP